MSKEFYFGEKYSYKTPKIRIETSFFNHWAFIRFSINGDSGNINFSFGCFLFTIYLTFHKFIPESWYPQKYSKYTKSMLPVKKVIELNLSIDHWFWYLSWKCWIDDDSWDDVRDKWWRKFGINFHSLVVGKHDCTFEEIEREQFLLPFYEGNYNVEVIKKRRIDKWQRWFTKKSISYEVECGYYDDEKNWIPFAIPHEGKGENSWDCGEDGTYSSSFPADFRRSKIFAMKNCTDAVMFFFAEQMKTRIRYGGKQWMPRGNKKELTFLKRA